VSDVNEIKALHRVAMERTDLALAARQRGDENYVSLFEDAYRFELQAATLAKDSPEPNRSILLRSAASLALGCNLLQDAEKLICTALSGTPPDEIAEELRDLLEQVNFQRHLALRGITLQSDEIQMSIAGGAVGYGIAPIQAFVERVQKTEALLYRTAERKQQKPYRDRGPRDKSLREGFELYMSAPRPGSLAVTFKVGESEQLNLFGPSMAEEVIDELVECLKLFTHKEETQLKERIKEEAYFRNFVGLAQGIAPDGRGVRMVGFTTISRGRLNRVALEPKRDAPREEAPSAEVRTAHDDTVEVSGILRRADSLKEGRNEIVIVSADNTRHRVVVPPGMMSDIVKPLWETQVIVKGLRKGKTISLQEIRPIDET
jgi:hypothetical protein